jgi:thiol-disulfide isomerase/thioredoxin
VLTVLPGCGLEGAEDADPYVFDSDQAGVKVDTPQLRAQKLAAGIEACPEAGPSSATSDVDTDRLPDITLPCLGGGRSVNLSALTGMPTVINLWAQNCGPCRAESPLFQRLHDEAGDRVRVLGLDFLDPRPGYALAFADELGLTYPQLADPDGATRAALRVAGLPMTLFVDTDGVITHVEYGEVKSVAQLRQLVARHLQVTL